MQFWFHIFCEKKNSFQKFLFSWTQKSNNFDVFTIIHIFEAIKLAKHLLLYFLILSFNIGNLKILFSYWTVEVNCDSTAYFMNVFPFVSKNQMPNFAGSNSLKKKYSPSQVVKCF